MSTQTAVTVVPEEAAYQICAELRRGKIYTVSGLWCWGCATFTKGDPAQMCGAIVACPQVVVRYQKQNR